MERTGRCLDLEARSQHITYVYTPPETGPNRTDAELGREGAHSKYAVTRKRLALGVVLFFCSSMCIPYWLAFCSVFVSFSSAPRDIVWGKPCKNSQPGISHPRIPEANQEYRAMRETPTRWDKWPLCCGMDLVRRVCTQVYGVHMLGPAPSSGKQGSKHGPPVRVVCGW